MKTKLDELVYHPHVVDLAKYGEYGIKYSKNNHSYEELPQDVVFDENKILDDLKELLEEQSISFHDRIVMLYSLCSHLLQKDSFYELD